MNRLFAAGVLCSIAFYTGAAGAQSRGGGRIAPAGGAAPHAGPRGAGAPGLSVNARSVVVRPQPRAPIRGTIGRPAFGIPVGSFYQPFLWTAPVYPNVPVYPAAPYASAEYPPSEPSQVDELSYQVERLTQEVQRLRQEQELQYTQPPGPRDSPVASERPAPPTILVFRDGLQTETLGYAIVGETLWILTAQSSTKIPLSDLDLEATQKRNTERGIRFLLPRK